MVTIKDVAEEAGVSIATVSRTLNNNYPVSEKSRKKVLNAIKKLKYRPNDIARSLKINKTDTIGLVVPDLSNPYFMDIAVEIDRKLVKHGYNILFANTQEDADKEIRYLETFYERRVDFLVLATRQTDPEKINELIDQGLKIILMDSAIEDVKTDIIMEDNYGGAFELTEKLIEAGHRDIGIIRGLMSVSTAKDRYSGFCDACKKHNISIKKEFIIDGYYNRNDTYISTLSRFNKLKKKPTAIFSTNNYMSEGFMIACKKLGISIPEDISLVSFGEINNPELIHPKLTIIKQDSKSIGELVGDIIIKRLNIEKPKELRKHIVDTKIRDGNSIKPI